MAIFGIEEEIKQNITDKENTSLVPIYDSERVDTSLLVTMSGYNWEVTYLHRKIDENTSITQFDTELDITLQEYIRVNKLIIKVDTPLPTGVPDNLSGSGIIDFNIVPNPNDVFLTKLPDGRTAIFTVQKVERINYNNNNLFKIGYSIYTAFDNTQDGIFTKLMKSVYEEFTYNKDYRLTRTSPMYSNDDIVIRSKFTEHITNLLGYWVNEFITPDTNYYIAYTDKQILHYDIHMEHFIRNTIGIGNLNNRVEIIDLESKYTSILEYLVNETLSKTTIKKYSKHKRPSEYTNNPYLYALSYNGIGRITEVTDMAELDQDTYEIINEFFPKVSNSYYIFSRNIYRVLEGESIDLILEHLTMYEKLFLSTITGNIPNKDDITKLVDNIYEIPTKEQFYFIPILIYIMKYYLTTFTVKFI